MDFKNEKERETLQRIKTHKVKQNMSENSLESLKGVIQMK